MENWTQISGKLGPKISEKLSIKISGELGIIFKNFFL
jgi:hypothetical protein